MLADEVDFVVGVDTHRDWHSLAVVEVRNGAVVCETRVPTNSSGYADALRFAELHGMGRRAFAVEGTGSYGAGLARFLAGRGERVLEVGFVRRESRSAGKTDALDAVRAARSVLAKKRPTSPRSSGEREALRTLVAAREGAVNAKRAGLCQLRDLLVTAPEPLRSELRVLSPSSSRSSPGCGSSRASSGPGVARDPARVAGSRSSSARPDDRGARARP